MADKRIAEASITYQYSFSEFEESGYEFDKMTEDEISDFFKQELLEDIHELLKGGNENLKMAIGVTLKNMR